MTTPIGGPTEPLEIPGSGAPTAESSSTGTGDTISSAGSTSFALEPSISILDWGSLRQEIVQLRKELFEGDTINAQFTRDFYNTIADSFIGLDDVLDATLSQYGDAVLISEDIFQAAHFDTTIFQSFPLEIINQIDDVNEYVDLFNAMEQWAFDVLDYYFAYLDYEQAQADFSAGNINQAQFDAATATFNTAVSSYNTDRSALQSAVATWNSYANSRNSEIAVYQQDQANYQELVEGDGGLNERIAQLNSDRAELGLSAITPSTLPVPPEKPKLPIIQINGTTNENSDPARIGIPVVTNPGGANFTDDQLDAYFNDLNTIGSNIGTTTPLTPGPVEGDLVTIWEVPILGTIFLLFDLIEAIASTSSIIDQSAKLRNDIFDFNFFQLRERPDPVRLEAIFEEIPEVFITNNVSVQPGSFGAGASLTAAATAAGLDSPNLGAVTAEAIISSFRDADEEPLDPEFVRLLQLLINKLLSSLSVGAAPVTLARLGVSGIGIDGNDPSIGGVRTQAFLDQTINLIESGIIDQTVTKLLEQEFGSDSPDVEKLKGPITKALNFSLLNFSIGNVSRSLGLPGLTTQTLLAATDTASLRGLIPLVSGPTVADVTSNPISQLFLKQNLSDQIQFQTGLSPQEANEIANNSINALANQGNLSEEELIQLLIGELTDRGIEGASAETIAIAIALRIINEANLPNLDFLTPEELAIDRIINELLDPEDTLLRQIQQEFEETQERISDSLERAREEALEANDRIAQQNIEAQLEEARRLRYELNIAISSGVQQEIIAAIEAANRGAFRGELEPLNKLAIGLETASEAEATERDERIATVLRGTLSNDSTILREVRENAISDLVTAGFTQQEAISISSDLIRVIAGRREQGPLSSLSTDRLEGADVDSLVRSRAIDLVDERFSSHLAEQNADDLIASLNRAEVLLRDTLIDLTAKDNQRYDDRLQETLRVTRRPTVETNNYQSSIEDPGKRLIHSFNVGIMQPESTMPDTPASKPAAPIGKNIDIPA